MHLYHGWVQTGRARGNAVASERLLPSYWDLPVKVTAGTGTEFPQPQAPASLRHSAQPERPTSWAVGVGGEKGCAGRSAGMRSRHQVGPERSATSAVQRVLTGANWTRLLDLCEPSFSLFFTEGPTYHSFFFFF